MYQRSLYNTATTSYYTNDIYIYIHMHCCYVYIVLYMIRVCKALSRFPTLSRLANFARFSCFMVLLCKVISGDELEVSHAVLLQNKDEVQIPLESLGNWRDNWGHEPGE